MILRKTRFFRPVKATNVIAAGQQKIIYALNVDIGRPVYIFDIPIFETLNWDRIIYI